MCVYIYKYKGKPSTTENYCGWVSSWAVAQTPEPVECIIAFPTRAAIKKYMDGLGEAAKAYSVVKMKYKKEIKDLQA